MAMDINNISAEEHKRVLIAQRFGVVYPHTEKCVDLLWGCLRSAEFLAQIFVRYLCYCQKHALLALLSAVRSHQVQAMANMRQVLESGVMAAYSLRNLEEATKIEATQERDASDKLKKKAYAWIATAYPDKSESFRKQKNLINESTAHPVLAYTDKTFDIEGSEKFVSNVFDKEDIFEVQTTLFFIANTTLGILETLFQIAEETKYARFVDGFKNQLFALWKENSELNIPMEEHQRKRLEKSEKA